MKQKSSEEKIKEVEKEIEKLRFEKLKQKDKIVKEILFNHIGRKEAQLSILKQWEAREKEIFEGIKLIQKKTNQLRSSADIRDMNVIINLVKQKIKGEEK